MEIEFYGSHGKKNLQNGSQIYIFGSISGIICINCGIIILNKTYNKQIIMKIK
jgi:TM2 domain-containing membrane protein YozV